MNKKAILKRTSYLFMALVFYMSYLFRVDKKKILLIMTHDSSDEGNAGAVYSYFNQQNHELVFKKVTRDNYTFKKDVHLIKKLLYLFLAVPYHMATSGTIFMDNVFLPFSYIKLKGDTRLVQLWHATGSIKRFGVEYEEEWVQNLAVGTIRNTTHFIAGSNWMKEIYKTAFKTAEDKIFATGTPRTDLFFNQTIIAKREKEFYQDHPELKDKKLILYAPTFRDEETEQDEIDIQMDMDHLLSQLGEEYILGLRFHPYIRSKVKIDHILNGPYQNRIYDFSNFKRLNTLLFCSAILITDYSSIIFEYALTGKSMIFYPYDLDKFENNSRGFYENYHEMVPGPVAFKTSDIAGIINEDALYSYDNESFTKMYLERCDGNSCKRLYELLMPPYNR